MARSSAFAVANFIIRKSREERIPVTHLMLQKLVYFCYAWFAGNEHEELFPEDIEAWQYGPVVRELYTELKSYGSEPIYEFIRTVDWESGQDIVPKVDDELGAELSTIWDAYKNKSAAWLVAASHTADEPWTFVAQKFGTGAKRKIPFALIKKIYSERVERIPASLGTPKTQSRSGDHTVKRTTRVCGGSSNSRTG